MFPIVGISICATKLQARELGDFVPIKQTEATSGSRLVRDDGSGDEDEGRIEVRGLDLPSDKPKRECEHVYHFMPYQ